MKFICFPFCMIFSFLVIAQSQDSCGFVVLDHHTKELLPFANVATRNRLLYSDSMGVFHLKPAYSDSIWISLPGYTPILTKYKSRKKTRDTFYLFPNSYELSPVKIVGQKQRKSYKIGKRNRYWDMEWHTRRQCTLESFIPNHTHQHGRLIKGYLFLIDHKRGENPTITVSFYKSKKGEIGKPIAENITFLSKSNWKKTGWFRLKINESIKFPRKGFYVIIRKKKETHNDLGIGFLELKNAKGNSYFYCQSDRKHKRRINEKLPFKQFGIKMYFIIE